MINVPRRGLVTYAVASQSDSNVEWQFSENASISKCFYFYFSNFIMRKKGQSRDN